MSWAKTPRILLVIPKFEKVTLRQVDYKILQRHASTLGAQVGLVTRVRRIRAEAEALGIPVFESTGQAQRESWPKSRQKRLPHKVPDKTLRERREQVQVREEAWRGNPITRVLAFTVGVLSVLGIVALFIPRAQVTLSPVVKTQSISLSVNANQSFDDVFVTGNIPAHEKRIVIDGSKTITATGGSNTNSVKASDADRKRAKELLMKSLEDSARQKFLDELDSDDMFFESTMEMTQILSEKYDPPPGTSGVKLTLTMQVEFTAQYASASDVTKLAALAMNASLPSGFHSVSDAVTVTPLTNPFLDDDGALKWSIRAEREIIQLFDPMYVTGLVQGLGANEAQSNIEKNLPKESKPVIQLSPSWWRWMPLLPFRIEVVTEGGR
jgi:hypothetical protein